jgi:hypothetical protein
VWHAACTSDQEGWQASRHVASGPVVPCVAVEARREFLLPFGSEGRACLGTQEERAFLREDERHNNEMQLTGGEGGARGETERASSRVAARS